MPLSGTAGAADVGTHNVTITATDPSGESVSDNFVLTVEAAAPPPQPPRRSSGGCTVGPLNGTIDPTLPLLMLISLVYLQRRRLISGSLGNPINPVQLDFVDDDGDRLSYVLTGLPAGSGLILDQETGIISGTVTNADAAAAPYTMNARAFDGVRFSPSNQGSIDFTLGGANLWIGCRRL